MGIGSSQQAQGDDDGVEQQAMYRYPPATGLYFGSQFTMGGQAFPGMQPESFLFGEMDDLNFLARIPGVLPQVPPNIRHTNTVRSLVHLRKESLKLRRHANASGPLDSYHLEFLFDADVPCDITIFLFAKEYFEKQGRIRYKPLDERLSSPTVRYDPGMNQLYRHPEFSISQLQAHADHLFFDPESMTFPIVIVLEAVTTGGPQPADDGGTHAHATLATFEQSSPEGPYSARPLIQKINVGRLSYILKEIYGLEHKPSDQADGDDDDDDNTECVVCMSESRDTMVLPCRHLCLCNPCAEVLRYQANKCPICRAPFHSLLQLRVAKPLGSQQPEDEDADDDGAPPGYHLVPVVDAFNGSTRSDLTDGASDHQARDSVDYLQVSGVGDLDDTAAAASASATTSERGGASASTSPVQGFGATAKQSSRLAVNPTYAAAVPDRSGDLRNLPISDGPQAAEGDDVVVSLPGTPSVSRPESAETRPETAASAASLSGVEATFSSSTPADL
eukprot:m.262506 g.262506  ORF g.262506 m.262506 type:complete len:504 (-) comp19231_c1_seq3:53-1564(-)